MALRKRRSASGVTGLVGPDGAPVSAAQLARDAAAADRKARGLVTLDDVVGERPPDEVATTAHYRLRAFYRKILKGGQREDSLLQEIAKSTDRGWLGFVLEGIDAKQPGPSARTRRRWRQAVVFRLSELPEDAVGTPGPSWPTVPPVPDLQPGEEPNFELPVAEATP